MEKTKVGFEESRSGGEKTKVGFGESRSGGEKTQVGFEESRSGGGSEIDKEVDRTATHVRLGVRGTLPFAQRSFVIRVR